MLRCPEHSSISTVTNTKLYTTTKITRHINVKLGPAFAPQEN